MSQSLGNVIIAIKAVDEASGVFDKIQTSMGLLGGAITQLGGPLGGLGSIISGFAAGGVAGAGMVAIGQIGSFLKDAVKDAGESERIFNLLAEAVGKSGTAWLDVKTNVESALTSMSSMSRFSDEELAQSLTTMIQHGMSVEEAMKGLQTAMDTSVGTGRDLQTVSEAIGKAYEGQTGPLARIVPAVGDLGKNMGEGATAGDKFNTALGLLNERFSGTAASDAETFAGVQERMANAWNEFSEKVGNVIIPLLTDLLSGIMKIGSEGIGPLMDALGELWSALFGGDEEAAKDFGRFIQDTIIFVLKGLATFIREDVVPVVKIFAEAFQKASDILGPPLIAMAGAIKDFLTVIHDAFQGFYDWLVGASLWTDLWEKIVSIAQGLGETVGGVMTGLFTIWQGIFQLGMDTISTIITTGFQLAFTTAQQIVQTGTDLMKQIFQGFIDLVGGGQKTWNDLTGSVNTNIDSMKAKIKGFFDWLSPFWESATAAFLGTGLNWLTQLNEEMRPKLNDMKSIWSSALSDMAGDAAAYFNRIVAEISAAVDQIIAKLNAARSQATGRSIWPDMLSDMLSQTQDYMGRIENAFGSGLQGGVIPTMEQAAGAAATSGGASLTPSSSQEITIPVTVMLDGDAIYTAVERRQIETLSREAGRSKRSTT